ncbi:MAG: hypothetical protein LUG93_14925 [Lachnospiraceae bacterium]|nr:hypothetical protein [Lachnospiraceae bacterium]
MEIKSSKKKNRKNSGHHPQCRRTGTWNRRILSLLVVLCMLCASVPVFVSSEETKYLPSETVLAESDLAAAVAETSGTDEPADNAEAVSETEAVTEAATETEDTTESETSVAMEAAIEPETTVATEAVTELETTAATEAATESETETEEAEETGVTTEAETEAVTEEETDEKMILTADAAIYAEAAVNSVTITWGAMAFTYTDSEQKWDPATHTYETESEGGWTTDETDGGKITVENDGNVDIAVNYSFALNTENSAAAALSGTFVDSSGTKLTESSTVLPTDDTTTAWLVLSGEPTKNMKDATIGSVTVTIAEADTE